MSTTSPGISPSDLRTAYGVAGSTAPAGTTVGIVVDYNSPDVESDLAAYRAHWGLPACTTANGCFRKVDQKGNTVPAGRPSNVNLPPEATTDWQFSTAEYTQVVSATCPSCNILLVENNEDQTVDGTGLAARLAETLGATVISVSAGSPGTGDVATSWAGITVPVFTGAGNSGWNNSELPGTPRETYPAALPNVITVGGTSATGSGGTLGTPTAWTHGGSGCSWVLPATAAQQAYFTATGLTPGMPDSCGAAGSVRRAYADLAAIADPDHPGFAVDRAGTWTTIGGTGLATHIVVGLAAYAGRRSVGSSIADVAYTRAAAGLTTGLLDVTSGSNAPAGSACTGARICTSSAGWDGPTGLGTPVDTSAFAPLIAAVGNSVRPGQVVPVSGSNFFPGETVTLTAGGVTLGAVSATASGAWSSTVTVPQGSRGDWPVTVTGSRSALTGTTALHVPVGHLDVPTTALVPGQPFVATASDMWGGEKVAFRAAGGGADVVVTADAAGKAVANLVVPVAAGASVAVTATGRSSGLVPTATVAVTPATLTPSSATAVPGTVVGLSGAGFAVGATVQFSASGATPPGPVRVGSDGTFTTPLTVPPAAPGSVAVTASAGGRQATATVTLPATTASVWDSLDAGTSAPLTGAGFAAGEAVSLTTSGPGQLALPATLTAGPDGAVSARVSASVTACPGPTTVTLVGGSSHRSASATTTVTPRGGIYAGCTAPVNTVLLSPDGQYHLSVQADGNLVLYRGTHVLWGSMTVSSTAQLVMQTDGNLVLYGARGALWSTNTWRDGPGSSLHLQDDGNLVLYRANGTPAWYSGYAQAEAFMNTQEVLYPGWSLHTLSGRYSLVMQRDGNLVEYDNSTGAALWNTGTWMDPGAMLQYYPYYDVLRLQDSVRGQLATFGTGGLYLEIQDDGNVVNYDLYGHPRWSRMYG